MLLQTTVMRTVGTKHFHPDLHVLCTVAGYALLDDTAHTQLHVRRLAVDTLCTLAYTDIVTAVMRAQVVTAAHRPYSERWAHNPLDPSVHC